MCNIVGGTKGIESSAEFSTVVCTHATWVAKKLENLFTDSISDGSTTLIVDKGEYTKLAKAADGTEDVHGIGAIPQTNYQVQGPFAPRSGGQREELPLPRAMCFPSSKLAFEAGRRVLRAVGLHIGPKAFKL
jgi:hypothetical protein